MSSWWNDRENKQELQIDGFWLDSFSLEKKSLDFSLQMKSENKVNEKWKQSKEKKRKLFKCQEKTRNQFVLIKFS